MSLKSKYLLAFLFCSLMVSSIVLIVEKKESIYKSNPPNLERLVNAHPVNWYPIKNSVTNPAWLADAKSEYDKVSAKTYRNTYGQEITIIMTWSRNGLQKAGHMQQLCYSSQGFSITDQHNIEVPIKSTALRVTNFVASQINGQVEDVFYWRITGGRLMKNIEITGLDDQRLSQRILRIKEVVKHIFVKIPDNIMVRVTARRLNSNEPNMLPVYYIKEYLGSLSSQDLKLLTGI